MKQKLFYLLLIFMMFGLVSCSDSNIITDYYHSIPVFIDFVNNTSESISYDCKRLSLGYTYDNASEIYRFDPTQLAYSDCLLVADSISRCSHIIGIYSLAAVSPHQAV